MSVSVGISIGAREVRAVVLRNGRVAAATEAELAPGDTLADAVAEVLAGAPVPRFPRPAVVAALGPSRAQVRRVTGLPPVKDPRVLAEILREGTSRFFLQNGAALVTTGVRVEAPGTAWGAALDAAAVRAAEEGCRRAGFRLSSVVPAVAVLPAGLAGDRLVLRDGAVTAEVEVDEKRRLRSIRRIPAAAALATTDDGAAVDALAPVGARAAHFAAAYGAALAGMAEPLSLVPGMHGAQERGTVPAWRLAVAGTALALSVAFFAVAPAKRAERAQDRAAARLEALARTRSQSARTAGDLREVTDALGEVSGFAARRRSPTLLLAALTRALPPGTSLVSLQVDSTGGSVVALAPRAAAVMAAMDRVPGVAAPEILGAVTREAAAGRQVERVTIRFSFPGTPASSAASSERAAERRPGEDRVPPATPRAPGLAGEGPL